MQCPCYRIFHESYAYSSMSNKETTTVICPNKRDLRYTLPLTCNVLRLETGLNFARQKVPNVTSLRYDAAKTIKPRRPISASIFQREVIIMIAMYYPMERFSHIEILELNVHELKR